MKLLITSTDHAFSIEVRLALDEANIEYFCSDADTSLAGLGGAAGMNSRIYLLDDADWIRAIEVIKSLSATNAYAKPAPISASTPFPRWLIVTISLFTVLALGIALSSAK
jgi:hypothetical protein